MVDLAAEIASLDVKLNDLHILMLKYEGAREYLASLLSIKEGKDDQDHN